MFHDEWIKKVEEELSRGETARGEGFEGRARVCARRAAGMAIRAYLEQKGLPVQRMSAYDLLVFFADELNADPGAAPISYPAGEAQALLRVTGHLLARVDETYSLPDDIDLLSEARWLAQTLAASFQSGDG